MIVFIYFRIECRLEKVRKLLFKIDVLQGFQIQTKRRFYEFVLKQILVQKRILICIRKHILRIDNEY